MSKIKILYHYSFACKEQKSGIPYFVQELYAALEDINTIEIEKTICISKYISTKNWKLFRFVEKVLYQNIYIPLKLYVGNYDVYIETSYIFNPLFKPKNVLIVNYIYDIGLILFDDIQTYAYTQNWRKNIKKSIKNSDILLTLSDASKDDIKYYLTTIKEDNKPVHVTYASSISVLSKTMKCQSLIQNIIDRYNYFLVLGTLEPRKNPLNILKAYHIYKRSNNDSTTKLIFAGKNGWLYDDIFSYIQKYHLSNDVIMTGYITDSEKHCLLSNAEAFLFLPKYEGFGMPALEAIRLNLPTLLSDIKVFHELFNTNVYYANYTNPKEIALMLEKLIALPPHIDHDYLSKFTWENTAKKLEIIISKYI